LNADPGADAACPGSFGAVALRHVCDGCPVVPGDMADAVATAVAAKEAATARIAMKRCITHLLVGSRLP
jgi:hypothetical protein